MKAQTVSTQSAAQKTKRTIRTQKGINRSIPELNKVCEAAETIARSKGAALNAADFAPALSQFELTSELRESILNHKEDYHILIRNERMKIVIISWPEGKQSSIHGHPERGCLFKVLQGGLTELRYTIDEQPKCLSVTKMSTGAMGYIDDRMGYHAVGNEKRKTAISIHAYTPGM